MMSTQPARGMRDFLPEDVRRREYVVAIIRDVYDRYGFEPLETPAVENLETLFGKYGDEGNKLTFKILKRGEHEASGQADLALRYDLTVPLARVVAEYQAKLPRIFKRYQIQPVWRAERPARGRFREFYQCDIDSIGSRSAMVEAEQLAAAAEILTALGFDDFVIRVNHRKLLAALLERVPVQSDRHAEVLVTIDKVDKIGKDGVAAELAEKGYSGEQISRVTNWIGVHHPPQWLDSLESEFPVAEDNGIANMREIVRLTSQTAAAEKLRVDPSLARGLGYYTGAIMEINVKDLPGSVGGGGRYDNLVGMFLGTDVPACGFSLGLERLLVALHERGMFPASVDRSCVDVVVAAIDDNARMAAMETATELRKATRFRIDLYPDTVKKLDRVFKYVDQRKARFLAVLGGDEVAARTVTIRNVATKTNETMPKTQVASFLTRSVNGEPDPSA
jgi:histidyl-tRNA synthetase